VYQEKEFLQLDCTFEQNKFYLKTVKETPNPLVFNSTLSLIWWSK